MSSIFSNFKRKARSRAKAEHTSTSKAKPLDILPGLTEIEEEDPRPSTSSTSSTYSFTSPYYLSPTYRASRSIGDSQILVTGSSKSTFQDAADRKRDSRRVVLTGVEGLTFEDFFPVSAAPPRPAPSPPRVVARLPSPRRPAFEDPFAVIESPLDSINFRFSGLHLEFDGPTTPSTGRSSSPTPSFASSRTTSTTTSTASATPRTSIFTPPTSDDESQAKPHHYSNLDRAPTCKSHRASVLYMKPVPEMQRRSRRRESAVFSAIPAREEADDSDSEDVSWFARELSDFVCMLPSVPEPLLHETRRSRPDSFLPPPRATVDRSTYDQTSSRVSRLYTQTPYGPSVQLDPTFPQKKRHGVPSRPPPPPPIIIEPPPSPTMEEKTEELLAMLANAAMDLNFPGTGLTGSSLELPPSVPVTPSSAFAIVSPPPSRPPPRSSIPADVDFFDDNRSPEERAPFSGEHEDSIEFNIDNLSGAEYSPTPTCGFSVYSQASVSLDTIPVELETPKRRGGFNCETPVSPAMPDSTFVACPLFPFVMEAPLQSRLIIVS
ncbi:hypothetical protein BDY19DRAFT_158710 [Irpex rosettiformis]|uniref:Uncharacterized protein n=1 Tax=Irpex rosettiformis TaxID=378272 RepID=A0ACB8U3Z3_9APHY|nr:hypothetical protein BDY19DRAFT_158710 [Irpex rosettiformis]